MGRGRSASPDPNHRLDAENPEGRWDNLNGERHFFMKWLDRLFGGPKDMAALLSGTKAPDFSLAALDGANFSLREALEKGPVLAAFFKVSCPTCQYTFPYLERLHEAHGDQKVTVIGISQNNAGDTATFAKEYGVTFRILLDDPSGYAVSNAYGLTN